MNCCQCQAIEELYTVKNVTKALARYIKNGPDRPTRMLVEAILKEGIEGFTLLDIGGGVGGIQHKLLISGVSYATGVEASRAYIQISQAEAQRRNLADKVSFFHGNFVDLAENIAPADIVTLDKVICCYPDVEKLVGLSAERAKKIVGLVYPRDTWWSKVIEVLANFANQIQRTPFRVFVHSERVFNEILGQNGFKRSFYHHTPLWQVAVYTR